MTATLQAPPGAHRVTTARTVAELETVRDAWHAFRWPRVDADLDFLAALIEASPGDVRPHVSVLEAGGEPRAMLVGRVERTRLETHVGYRTVLRPGVRMLTVAHGGLAGGDAWSSALVEEAERTLAAGEADVASLPSLRSDSALYSSARAKPSWRSRDRMASVQAHRRLELPGSFDEFLRSRSKSTRESIKRYSRKLEAALGDRLSFRLFDAAGEIDELFSAVEPIAVKTYQRGLGVALGDDPRNRRLISLGLERGWFKVWVLSLADEPVAFWPGWLYDRTFFIGTPGYDPALSEHRLGQYVLMRVIGDLCEDSGADACDFGFGDSEYKRRFSNQEWEEGDVLVFAPSLKGARLNFSRTAVLLGERGLRRAVARAGLEERLKRGWRRRLSRAPEAG